MALSTAIHLAARRRASVVAACAAVATTFLGGCLMMQANTDRTERNLGVKDQKASLAGPADNRLTETQLEELVQGFADRYYAMVSGACDALSRVTTDPDKRLLIDRLQTRTITAVYDIASNEDPFTKLLDLTVVVTLTSTLVIDEGRADELFGPDAQIIMRPMRKAREEIWEIAARALTSEQLETLDRLILEWRRQNPDVETVSFVRFDDFATSRGKSIIADVRTGGGLLAPVDEARKSVDQAVLFGERVFYMSKRAPLLVSMESGALLSQIAAMPELRQGLAMAGRLTENLDRLTAVAEEMPKTLLDEREKIVQSIDQTSGSLRQTLAEYEKAIGQTEQLVHSVQDLSGSARDVMSSLDTAAGSLTKTLEAAERLAVQARGSPSEQKPVDPELYARMVADLRGSLVEVNKALENSKTLAEGSLWEKPLAALSAESDQRVKQLSGEMRGIVDRLALWAFAWAGGMAFLIFLLLVAYRRMQARKNVGPQASA